MAGDLAVFAPATSTTSGVETTENHYWKNVLIAVPVLMCSLATLSYILRLVCRGLIKGPTIKTDDVLMGIGLLLSYGVTAFTVYTAFNGVGVPTSELPPAERRRINFGSWMIQKFWAPSMAFIKTSIIVFLNSTLGLARTFRTTAYVLIVFITLWATAALLTNIFQCSPVQYYYDKTIEGGHCMSGQTNFFQAMGSFSLIADVAIVVLPIPVILKLGLTSKQKMAVIAILSLGIFVCVFSLLRLVEFNHFITTDLSSSSAKESIWTTMEVNVAIICGCLPLMKPLFEGCFGRLASSTGGYRSKSSSQPPNQASSSQLYYRSAASRNDKNFHKLADLQTTAWSPSPSDKTSERQLRNGSRLGRSRSDEADEERSSSEIELGGIGVQTDIYQTAEEHHQKEQRSEQIL